MSEAAFLDELITDAAQLMQQRSGGESVCSFTKAGESVPGLKYAEGRWAALREVRRSAGSGGELSRVVAEATISWETHLDRLASRSAGRDWIAYRNGGVDALTDLAQSLRSEQR